MPAFRIEAVSHHQVETARQAAAKWQVPHAFASSEELVLHPDLDLVVVAVKVTRHRELITQAIEAGKAVLSEWPLGTSLAEAQALSELAIGRNAITAIGLQTRAAPAFAQARNLVRQGYVGDVLSVSLLGSGIAWGESMSEDFAYTLEPENGASMLTVPFAHSIDGLLHVLDTRVESVTGQLGNARRVIRMDETGAMRPLSVPDQVMVTGRLANGAFLSAHFRGGLSRGTNFHVEINGTQGDLVLTGPIGYVGGLKLLGARASETLHELAIPPELDAYGALPELARHLAAAYARLAADFRDASRLSPNFQDAVDLHRLVDAIANSHGQARQL